MAPELAEVVNVCEGKKFSSFSASSVDGLFKSISFNGVVNVFYCVNLIGDRRHTSIVEIKERWA